MLPITPASKGPEEGCLGLGHRGGSAIYSQGRHPPFLSPWARPGSSEASFQFLKAETAPLAPGLHHYKGTSSAQQLSPGKMAIALATSAQIHPGSL